MTPHGKNKGKGAEEKRVGVGRSKKKGGSLTGIRRKKDVKVREERGKKF